MKKMGIVILALLISLASYVCLGANSSQAEQWTQANGFFKKNIYWQGSDDAYSVKIGPNKVLWLFGDTLISKTGKKRTPEDVNMPRNTIGIETGLNPTDATIKYYWGNKNSISSPKSFFRSPDIAAENWLWPGDVTLLPEGKGMIIFFMNIKPVDYGYGFDIAGWQAALIRNYKESPENWNIEWLPTSDFSNLKMLIGSGGVLTEGNYLYAYSTKSDITGQNIYLARWPLSLFNDNQTADMSNPQWWTGAEGWISESQLDVKKLQPYMLWNNGQTEFTVNRLSNGKYLEIQTTPSVDWAGNADLSYRISDSLTGPWSDLTVFYHNLCRDNPKPNELMVYAGKLHPELIGGNYIFTFATNTQHIEALWDQPELYYPRFLKLDANIFNSQNN
ncbi:MAG TPA: hypothetical protein QF753_04435 [Victivallales bacterium]|nr:hypothetical protein [Victivallales bacterium]